VYDPETKQQSSQWKSPGSPKPKKAMHLPEDEDAALTEWRRSSVNRRMFLVRFENRTFSTGSSGGNGAGINVSLHKGTILNWVVPKLKSSKYILFYSAILGTF
jgi:hypothetical protein